MIKLKKTITLTLLFITVVLNAACAPRPLYIEYISELNAVDLGTLPGGRNSSAQDVNDGGYIVGYSDTSSSGNKRAFVIHGMGMQNLGTLPGGGESEAYGISNNGYIVGSARNNTDVLHGFVNRYNTMRDLGAFPPEDHIGSSSRAYAVNNTPWIAGQVDLAGVIWNLNGDPTYPPFPPYIRVTDPGPFKPAIAHAINNGGQVAGSLSGDARGFRWSSGSLEVLATLGPVDDDAYGINNHGHVVGKALLAPPVRYHAVLWRTPSSIQDLGTLGGTNSSARDINDNGTVVGYSETASGDTHAFIWRPKLGMRSLGTLGGSNSKAYAINSDGVIVGESETESGEIHATRWEVRIDRISLDYERFRPVPDP